MNTKPQKEYNINGLMESLSIHSKERKIIRRILCAYLRKHKDIINDGWLLRKIRGRWMGDLTDIKLLYYCKEVKEYLEG